MDEPRLGQVEGACWSSQRPLFILHPFSSGRAILPVRCMGFYIGLIGSCEWSFATGPARIMRYSSHGTTRRQQRFVTDTRFFSSLPRKPARLLVVLILVPLALAVRPLRSSPSISYASRGEPFRMEKLLGDAEVMLMLKSNH